MPQQIVMELTHQSAKTKRVRSKTRQRTIPDRKPSGDLGTLKIIPLGGCEEVGRNMTVFEYGNDIVILDMGIQFPEEDMPGIDYVIPNTEYLQGKEEKIQGVLFSHGHLDHIGAAPILLEKLGNPTIIGRPLTIEMIKHRQEDFSKDSSKRLKTIYIKDLNEKINLGVFTIRFFQVDHAIMDAVGIILETPVATIIHPGDWTIEHNPIGRKEITYTHLSRFKKPIILMLESLGAISNKKDVTEETMLNNLYELINSAEGRVIITTFSSQLERIKQILEYSSKIGKKIALDGFSMKLNVELAKQLGYIKPEKGSVIPINRIDDYSDNKVVIICTGAQGEEMSVLPRIINGNHRSINIKKTDTIIFSSSIIPGNERTIQRLKDNLYRLSDNVYHNEIIDVHISGHSDIKDIKNILRQIKPDYFIPVYANHFILKEAAKIAYEIGFKKDKVIVPDNGTIINVSKDDIRILKEKAPTNYVYVDGIGVGDIGEVVIRDRQTLSKDGMFVVIVTIDSQSGTIRTSPDIISRGFVYLRESKELLRDVRHLIRRIIERNIRFLGDEAPIIQEDQIKYRLREDIAEFLFRKTQRRPMVIPVVVKV